MQLVCEAGLKYTFMWYDISLLLLLSLKYG